LVALTEVIILVWIIDYRNNQR